MNHVRNSIVIAVLITLAVVGIAYAALQTPQVTSQNRNNFTVSMNPLDGSVRNWIYVHKAFPVGDSNDVTICVQSNTGGEWVQFKSVSVLADDNSEWEESSYSQWYEVPKGSCGSQAPPQPTPYPTYTPYPTPEPDRSSEWCMVAQTNSIQGDTLDKYRTLFPYAQNPSYPGIVSVWQGDGEISVTYQLDGFYEHSDGRSGEIWGIEWYSGCIHILSRILFVPFDWHGGDIEVLARHNQDHNDQ